MEGRHTIAAAGPERDEAVATKVGPREDATARDDKAPPCGAFASCAEEDSNLHPVIPDQALNLVTRVSYPSGSCQIVRLVRRRG